MITAFPGARTHFVGDSITSPGYRWFAVSGGFVDQVNAALPLVTTPPTYGVSSGRAATFTGTASIVVSTTRAVPLVTTESGVAGNKIADIQANVPGRITDFNPQIVVLEVGVNDAIAGTGTSAFRASYDAVLDAVIAWGSTTQILCIAAWMNGEQWASGPLRWTGPGANSAIDAINGQISASCAARSANCTYADIRAPTLTYESTHNTPEPGALSGVLADPPDGVHPNTTGKVQMGTYAFAYVAVSA